MGENTIHIMQFLKRKFYIHTHMLSLFFNVWRKGLGNWRSGKLPCHCISLCTTGFCLFFYHEHIFTDEETETQTGLSYLPKIIQIVKKKK